MQATLVAVGCALFILGAASIAFPSIARFPGRVASPVVARVRRLKYGNFMQLGGLFVLAAGVWMAWPWLGVSIAGVGLVLVGVATEIEGRSRSKSSSDPA